MTELDTFLDSIPCGFRKARFRELAQYLLDLKRPVHIVETGCMRPNDTPEGDGCSTLVWDWVVGQVNGQCLTIDIDSHNCDYSRAKTTTATVLCEDSIYSISRNVNLFAMHRIDLLYLDSMDFNGDATNKGLSALHHAGELAVAWKWVRSGGLIAVDDCCGPYEGKHAIVKRFFDLIGVQPLASDYIHVWRKP